MANALMISKEEKDQTSFSAGLWLEDFTQILQGCILHLDS